MTTKLKEKLFETIRSNPNLTITALARELGKPQSNVSFLVNFLAEEGQLELVPVTTNAKLVRIKPTQYTPKQCDRR